MNCDEIWITDVYGSMLKNVALNATFVDVETYTSIVVLK